MAPKIEIHPAAALFPLMPDEQIAELAESIKKHGLREPIQCLLRVGENVTDWIVLDGRNRLEALRRHLGKTDSELIEGYFRPVKLDAIHSTPEEYVMMANIERRNLTQPERRALAGKLVLMIQEANKEKPKAEQVNAKKEAAKKAGVSPRTAQAAAEEEKSKTKPKNPAKVKVPPTAEEVAARAPIVLSHLNRAMEGIKQVKAVTTWELSQIQEAKKLVAAAADVLDVVLAEKVKLIRAEADTLAELAGMTKPENEDAF